MRDQQERMEEAKAEKKQLSRAMRRASFHWGGSKGGPRRPRTGQPEWFQKMAWDRDRKKILCKLPVSELFTNGICTEKQANYLRDSGYKTVWSVVDAEYRHLLTVASFGPKTVAKLWQDLKIKGQIEPNWKPADGR